MATSRQKTTNGSQPRPSKNALKKAKKRQEQLTKPLDEKKEAFFAARKVRIHEERLKKQQAHLEKEKQIIEQIRLEQEQKLIARTARQEQQRQKQAEQTEQTPGSVLTPEVLAIAASYKEILLARRQSALSTTTPAVDPATKNLSTNDAQDAQAPSKVIAEHKAGKSETESRRERLSSIDNEQDSASPSTARKKTSPFSAETGSFNHGRSSPTFFQPPQPSIFSFSNFAHCVGTAIMFLLHSVGDLMCCLAEAYAAEGAHDAYQHTFVRH